MQRIAFIAEEYRSMATMKDIAKIAGVSLGTVSHVLTELQGSANQFAAVCLKRSAPPITNLANWHAVFGAFKPTS